jgi:prepilin-type N-terminal cleavage/methylation domain-containing protein
MKDLPSRKLDLGFTLIELLVVIAIVGILSALLFPAIQRALMRARMTEAMNNGRSLHQSIVAAEMDSHMVLPASSGSHAFDNSTDYFKWLVTNGMVEVTFDFFSAYGLPEARGVDAGKFTAEHNAWCVVADVGNGGHPSTPVLFTRNLSITALDDDLGDALTDGTPFGKAGVVVVTRGGSAGPLVARDLGESFNPIGATNAVLRP